MTNQKTQCSICGTEITGEPNENGELTCSFCFEKIKILTDTSIKKEFLANDDASSEKYTYKCKICDTVIEYTKDEAGTSVFCNICNEKVSLPSLAALVDNGQKYQNEDFDKQETNYIIHVLDILLQKGHRLLFLFVLINAAFAIIILQWLFMLFMHNEALSLVFAILVYFLSLMLMTSPLGEFYLRHSLGCRPIKREEDMNFLYPLVSNTLKAARRIDPNIPEDITFFMSEDRDINAFATGRKTVCVTRGLLQCPPRQIEAIIAHEFGHLSHKDTDVTLFVLVGNIVINAFFTVVNWIIVILKAILSIIGYIVGGFFSSRGTNGQSDLGGCLGFIFGGFLVFIWNKITALWWGICIFCQNRAGRQDEFRADEFSFNAGYGNDLCAAFDYMNKLSHADEDPGPQGLMAMLNSTHPPMTERIAHLQEMGANYAQEKKISKIC